MGISGDLGQTSSGSAFWGLAHAHLVSFRSPTPTPKVQSQVELHPFGTKRQSPCRTVEAVVPSSTSVQEPRTPLHPGGGGCGCKCHPILALGQDHLCCPMKICTHSHHHPDGGVCEVPALRLSWAPLFLQSCMVIASWCQRGGVLPVIGPLV